MFNVDQSGFNLEMHHQRNNAIRGLKKVEVLAQSTAALTHSVTIMPIYSAEGELLSPLFLVIGEQSGVFPQKGIFPVIH